MKLVNEKAGFRGFDPFDVAITEKEIRAFPVVFKLLISDHGIDWD